MLTLTKVLSLFVYPLSLGVFLIGLSLLGQLRGNRAAAGLYTFFALMVLYYPSTEFGVEAIAKPLEARYPAFSPEELPDGDTIVVLGGGIEAEGVYGRWGDLNHASDRVISAAELWHAKKAPKIIVSGGSTQGPISEASRMAELLKRLGVPASAISLEEKSLTQRATLAKCNTRKCRLTTHSSCNLFGTHATRGSALHGVRFSRHGSTHRSSCAALSQCSSRLDAADQASRCFHCSYPRMGGLLGGQAVGTF